MKKKTSKIFSCKDTFSLKTIQNDRNETDCYAEKCKDNSNTTYTPDSKLFRLKTLLKKLRERKVLLIS